MQRRGAREEEGGSNSQVASDAGPTRPLTVFNYLTHTLSCAPTKFPKNTLPEGGSPGKLPPPLEMLKMKTKLPHAHTKLRADKVSEEYSAGEGKVHAKMAPSQVYLIS